MDGVQYLHGRFAAVELVEHLVDFSVGPLADGLDDVPGLGGIREVVEDDGFPRLWKHLEERSPVRENAPGSRLDVRRRKVKNLQRARWSMEGDYISYDISFYSKVHVPFKENSSTIPVEQFRFHLDHCNLSSLNGKVPTQWY